MVSKRVQRVVFILVLMGMALLVGAAVLAYQLTRDPGFDWEKPNVVEAGHFRRKFKRFESAQAAGQEGYLRFTQLEVNSQIRLSMTNLVADTNAPGIRLDRVSLELGVTNLTVYSWGEYRVLNRPLKFVVQRGFRIDQEGAIPWNMPLEWMRVGQVEIPPQYWAKANSMLAPLDQPVRDAFAWTTNIPAFVVRKNELSERLELRLFTYKKPIRPEDLR